jgi:1-deoxy-D-xylulose-5-phosphate reductoisomerase
MKHVAVLGSTGSIGRNALAVIRDHPGEFSVAALSGYSNVTLLNRQVRSFRPGLICAGADRSALRRICTDRRIDHVLIAISGSAALDPLLWAIDAGKEISLANKEALVMAGPLVMAKAAARGVTIIPIDSEQSAIWQCLRAENRSGVRKIYLTASGGPFRGMSLKKLAKISVADALRHPRWKMGAKITIDSATLMNKGLEVIEAMHLFGLGLEQIEVLVHPESIIHSMVEFIDGSIIAQLSVTDMRIPIQYALSYPRRIENSMPSVDFVKTKAFHFEKPDMSAFGCLSLAIRAARIGGTMPAVLNAANDVAVAAFCERRVSFVNIPSVIERVMKAHRAKRRPGLEAIKEADAWARIEAAQTIGKAK